jgi:small subunit ribosomal protein S5
MTMTDPIEPQTTPTETPAPAAPETVAVETQAAPAEPPQQSGREQHGGRDQQGGDRRRQRGPRRDRGNERDEGGVESSLVRIYRCAKVVKGGRTFSFGALVVAGDRQGNVGIGYGKANEVPMAVEKATKDARRQMVKVPLKGSTIPHTVKGRCGASSVTLVPAMPGSGVTAGKSVRPVLELAGITDILSKAYGSTSPKNLVKATVDALRRLQSREEVERDRNVKLAGITGGKELAAV